MEAPAASDVVVFAGPTIGRREIDEIAPVTVRGPARRGDVYLATLSQPSKIILIDGTFDQTPAVWHKEILWALTLGIDVVGASSMGALRAAELHTFGMRGVGWIFDAFVSGELIADDEVAVIHASEEDGFRPLSEALVNIRATLRAAERDGVVSAGLRARLEESAQGLFYPERSFERLLQRAREQRLPPGELEALARWLPSGRIDQKKRDAQAALAELVAPRSAPPIPTFSFQQTEAWHRLRASLAGQPPTVPGKTPSGADAGAAPAEVPAGVWNRAVLRAIAVRDARTHQSRLAPGAVDAIVEQFRRERGLLDEAVFVNWLGGHFLNDAEAAQFFVEEALVRGLIERHAPAAIKHVKHELIARAPLGAQDSGTAPEDAATASSK